jgi:hypothetical protein
MTSHGVATLCTLASKCGPSFGHAVCSFNRACGSDGTCVARTNATAMEAAMGARDAAWFIYDNGYGRVGSCLMLATSSCS